MTMILEPARETPVIHETGVLVIGSGPGGLAAALAAALATLCRLASAAGGGGSGLLG